MRKTAIVTLSAAVLALSACDKGGREVAPSASASASSAGVEKAKGLRDPRNDKAIVALARPVLACKWGRYGFDAKCEALKAWKKSDAMKAGAGDATLVRFLEDDDVRVQWIGADGLAHYGLKYRADKAMARKVVDAADKVRAKQFVSLLGKAVGSIDLAKTGLAKRVMKMIESHANPELRRTLAGNTLFRNREVPGLFELLVRLAKSDKDKRVRKAAAAAFWTGTPAGKNEEVCKLWLDLADDPDSDLAGHCAYQCASMSLAGGCAGQWDDLLSLIERKAKAGEVRSSFMASALKYLYRQKNATAAQKNRALAVAKEIVKNVKNDAPSRSAALELVGKKDPGGKAFAAKYDKDEAFFVKNAAKRIKEGK